MSFSAALLRFLVFPGLLFAVPAAWIVLWIERKAVARLQRRVGPPFPQTVFDFVKLLGKSTPPRPGVEGFGLRTWPVLAAAGSLGAVALLPVLPRAGGFAGDLVLLLSLLELPAVLLILAGFSSRSPYGQLGSAREAVLSVAYNVVLLASVLALAAAQRSFRLEDLVGAGFSSPLRWIGVAGVLVCLPAKLHVNPFSAATAEQEIYAGALTEYAGPELALWELSHGLEWVAGTGLAATLLLPRIGSAWLAALAFLGVTLVLVLLLSTLAAATARFTIDRAVAFYWRAAALFVVAGATAAAFLRTRS